MVGRKSNRTFIGSRQKGREIILYRLKRSFLHGPKSKGMIQLRDHNGTTFLQEKRKILKRSSDQLHKLFNILGELDEAAKKVAKVNCCT